MHWEGWVGNALLYLTSILSYNQYFISGVSRPHKIWNYISKISVRYNNARLKPTHHCQYFIGKIHLFCGSEIKLFKSPCIRPICHGQNIIYINTTICCFTSWNHATGMSLKFGNINPCFLAHLTQRVMWAILITWRPSSSSVRRPSYVVNFFKNLLLWKY